MHVFRAGEQTDSTGQTRQFSETDLAACAKAYDPALHEAPITVGHPQTSAAPAYGWVKSLRAEGASLFAERDQMDPEFAEACRAGRYKKVSAAFYLPDSPRNPAPGVLYLHHVAMLGGQAPAVKGLKQATFAADDSADVLAFAEIEFGDPAFSYLVGLFRQMRDWVIEAQGLAKADQVIPSWQINSLEEMGRERDNPCMPEDDAQAISPFTEGAAALHPKEPSVTTATNTPDAAKLQADIDAANKRAKDAEDALAAERSARFEEARQTRAQEHVSFAESLADRLLPADRPAVLALLEAVEGGDKPMQFGEGDQAKPLGSAVRELLAKLPKHGLDGEHLATGAGRGSAAELGGLQFSEGTVVDTERAALHQRALAIAKAENLSYPDALAKARCA